MNAPNPIAARSPITTINPLELRRSLSCFPTGVAVVTTIGQLGGPVGVTISSFNAVSLDPPLVLWSLALKAASLADFRAADYFAVNVLSEAQAELPRVFSSSAKERFDGVSWQGGHGGAPVLAGCAAVFECSIYARHNGGDHEVIIGNVLRHSSSEASPLLYAKGRIGAVPDSLCQ
ncbi:MAG: flavin reductase family protein [Pseudomonadota bacterium]